MHITMLALGSYGDVLPLATLGKGLRAAGHQVRFITFENFAPMVADHGLDFHPIRGDIQALLNTAGGRTITESGRSGLRFWIGVMRMFGPAARDIARALSSPGIWETEAIINQLPIGLYGYDLAEKLGVPMLAAAVIPLTPTETQPVLGFPSRFSSLSGYNRWSYRIAYQMGWQGFRRAINRWRQETLGLPKTPFLGYPDLMVDGRVPVLNGFSKQVVPRPADWGDHVYVTGYWFPEHLDWLPPDDLRKFIEAGPPPVFIGFGSMPVRDPEETTAIILAALERTGQRGILHAGWAGIGDEDLPEGVLKIDYAPYAWLFPQMAGVVHHGGSGTTASGLQAGVPSLIVPILFDQFYWGNRLRALGVGPKPLPFKQLSVDRLAEALVRLTSDAEMRRNAAILGEKIRGEDGVANAVATVTKITC